MSEWNTTGTVTPGEKFTETAIPIISLSRSTKIDRKIAVRVTNNTELPYTINKNTQIAEFSVVITEQSKFNKPVDMAILSIIPEGDPDLITYLTELFRTNKPDQQNNTFWFPTPENPGNTEDHTPIQTRILTELRELQRKEKLNPKNMMLNQDSNSSNDLIGQTHCSAKLKNKQLKTFLWNIMIYLLATEWTLG